MILIGILCWIVLSIPVGILVGKAINRGNNIVYKDSSLDDLLGGVRE